MKKILTNKLFMTTFFTDMLSNFGDSLYYLALMSYVATLSQAKFAISLVTISETLPLFAGFFLGILADKNQKKVETILATQVFRVALYSLVGVVMGFTPGLWVVVIAATINLLSDISGQFENALYTPLSLRIIPNEDRESAMAFKQSISSVLQILFQASGAILISFFTYQHLAFFNAATFLVCFIVMFFLKPQLNRLLEANPIQATSEEIDGNFTAQIWGNLKLVVREIRQIPELRLSMLVVPVLNAIFGVLSVLLVLFISQSSQMMIYSVATTLSIFTIVMLVGQILGSVLVMSAFKNVDTMLVIRLTALLPAFIFLAFLMENIYFLLAVICLVSVLAGIINPKMNAMMLNVLPEDKMATIANGVSTYFVMGIVVTNLIVSGLVLVFSAHMIAGLFLAISLLLALYTLLTWKKSEMR